MTGAMPGRLAGKSAIVTGAGSGIGRAAAERFAAEGATVVCADVDLAAAELTAAAICSRGTDEIAIAIAIDVASETDAARMADTTLDWRGRIDVLYANAGIGGAGTAESVDVATWRRVMDVNLTGT